MLRLKEGDSVRIVDRPATPADLKSGLYFTYYRNVSGTVFKVFGTGETAQIAVEVDVETLPDEVAARHSETREAMRANLVGDAKRLSGPGQEQEFRLRYVVLVALADLARKVGATSRAA